MKFIGIRNPGGADVLEFKEGPIPQPSEGEVLIRVHSAGVNRPDIAQRQGKYPPPPGASPIMGLEVSGTIAAVGPNAEWKVGDQVCALTPGGGYAEYCVVPGAHCLPMIAGLSFDECAGIPETFFTVWANVFQIGQLKAGERFLVHGGTSGIGTTAIQLAHAFGAEVYATAGSDEKCRACLELGAKAAINYKTHDFPTEIKKLTQEQGVSLILDMIAGPYTAKNIDCLAPHGRLVQIATMQGAETTLNLMKVMQKRLTITGSTLRPRSVTEKAELARELRAKVWPLLEAKKVRVAVDRVFPFTQVREAHEYMESSQHIGKIILKFI